MGQGGEGSATSRTLRGLWEEKGESKGEMRGP